MKNYLEHIFRKLQLERKISYTYNNSHACFNTGLVTKNLEPIYALFETYRNIQQSVNPSQFCFKAFLKESDTQFLKIFPDNHPDIADFFQKPEDLIFNPRCRLIPQIDHIIEDNLLRFPAHIQALDSGEIRRRLDGAIEEVKKRIKRIKEYIGSWHKSEMMKALDKAHIPPVRSPIKKTNVFLKNPNFRVASALWEYLNKYGFNDNENSKDNVQSDGNDVIKGFLDHTFLINYYVLESISNSKREQKRQLSKYAVVMLKEEIKRIVDLLLSCGLKISEEDIMKLVAEELKQDKSDRLIGADDVKKKFKNAMDEYLERTQEYL